MKLTKEKIAAINDAYDKFGAKKFKATGKCRDHLLNIRDGITGATVYSDYMGICPIEQIDSLIEELTDMKNAITKETGIC